MEWSGCDVPGGFTVKAERGEDYLYSHYTVTQHFTKTCPDYSHKEQKTKLLPDLNETVNENLNVSASMTKEKL